MFQSEMYGRQQILQAIVTEGHQMVADGDIDDRVEFEKKLSGLEERWQNVIRRTNQKKALIDNNIAQWQTYNSQLERLNGKLGEMDQSLEKLEFSQAPVQKLKAMLENVMVSNRMLKR